MLENNSLQILNKQQDDVMSEYKELYQLIFETLKDNSPLNETEFNKRVEYWRNCPNIFQKDNDFFELIVDVTFYSGFRAKTVEDRLSEIHKVFGDYRKVMAYTFNDVEKILEEREVIGNVAKICSTILNAREFNRLIHEYGSFKSYLRENKFERGIWNEDTESLYEDLKKRFYYLSDVTAYHFLMDIGAFCIKPDRQVVALLELLGKVKVGENKKVIDIGREIAKQTGENIRVVDIVLVTMRQGDEFGFKTPICPNLCDRCLLNSRCNGVLKFE